jgi:hypothetical protein
MILLVILYLILETLSNLQSDSAKQFLQEGIANKPLMLISFIGNIFGYIYPVLFAIYLSTWYWGVALLVFGLVFGAMCTVLVRSNFDSMKLAYANMLSIVLIPIIILYLIYATITRTVG